MAGSNRPTVAGAPTDGGTPPDNPPQGPGDPPKGRDDPPAMPVGSASGGRPRPSAPAIRSAKTRPSSSELEASRLAPWTPVHAASPQAYSPGTLVRPNRSVRTPPLT